MDNRILLQRFDRVTLVSRAMGGGPVMWIRRSKLSVLHNALVTESYGRKLLDTPRRVTDPRGEVRLLNVGRLSPEKGQALLLQAVARLLPDYPGLVVWFAGTGPLQGELEAEARRLGLDGRVRFLTRPAGFVHGGVYAIVGRGPRRQEDRRDLGAGPRHDVRPGILDRIP